MKLVISILLTAGICSAATYFIVSQHTDAAIKAERAQLEARWKADKEKLEAELAVEKNRSPQIEHVKAEVAVTTKRSPKEILEKLLTLKPSGPGRISAIRKIVHQLEELTERGTNAVPAIREFLAQNQDIDYSSTDRGSDERDRGRGWTPPWQRSAPPTEFTLPPSLRIGLFDVLKEIEGEEAEKALAEVLKNSGRAVEVAYIARALEERAPGKYREVALTAAKDLLMNPLPIDNPNRLDEQAEGYLYGVLEMYKDTSFLDAARTLLVNAEGRLNRNAQDYLSKTQGEQAIPVLYDVLKKNTISNMWDKASVANTILDYVGSNAQANNFLNEVVTNTNLDTRMRSFAILRLAGGFGVESPTDPKIIQERKNVLEAIQAPELERSIGMTWTNLDRLSKGEAIVMPWGDRDRRGRSENPRSN